MKPFFQRLLLQFGLVLLSMAFATGVRAEDQSASLAEIPKAMQKYVDDHQISGAVTLVAKEGKVVDLEAVGLADVESKRPMKKDSMFCIASMTKPVTATALMILRDEGRLALTDPVSKYIPAFKGREVRRQAPASTDHALRPGHSHLGPRRQPAETRERCWKRRAFWPSGR